MSVARYAGGTTTSPFGGSATWSNASNFTGATDSAYAEASGASSALTYRLDGNAFGFTSGEVPDVATIDGFAIALRVRWNTPASNDVALTGCWLLDASGTVTPTNLVGSPYTLIGGWETINLGGPTELGGASWIPANVRDNDFGVAVQFTFGSGLGSTDVHCDSVEITVHLTGGGSGIVVPVMMNSFRQRWR